MLPLPWMPAEILGVSVAGPHFKSDFAYLNESQRLTMTSAKRIRMWAGAENLEISKFDRVTKLLWAHFGKMFPLLSHSINVQFEWDQDGVYLWTFVITLHIEIASVSLKARPYRQREDTPALRFDAGRTSDGPEIHGYSVPLTSHVHSAGRSLSRMNFREQMGYLTIVATFYFINNFYL